MAKEKIDLSLKWARDCFKTNPSSAISFILTAGYLYHFYNRSFLDDETFDKMCKYVYDNYETLEHPHKHLFTKEDMANGSLFHLKEQDYPNIVRVNAQMWLSEREKHYG